MEQDDKYLVKLIGGGLVAVAALVAGGMFCFPGLCPVRAGCLRTRAPAPKRGGRDE